MLLFARSEKYLLRLSNKSAIARGNEGMGEGREKKRREQDKNEIKGKREREKKRKRRRGCYDETGENAIFG